MHGRAQTHAHSVDSCLPVRHLTETESHNITQAGPTFSTNTNGTHALLNFYIKTEIKQRTDSMSIRFHFRL
jgi:hypothetical protein